MSVPTTSTFALAVAVPVTRVADAVTSCGPTPDAEQLRPVHVPSGPMPTVVRPVTSPSWLPYASEP